MPDLEASIDALLDDGLTYVEVAARLGITEDATRATADRIRRAGRSERGEDGGFRSIGDLSLEAVWRVASDVLEPQGADHE